MSCRRKSWRDWLHIARRDKLAWDEELEADFSPGGKHYKTLKEIDPGNCTPLP